jgi:hypothetical protein
LHWASEFIGKLYELGIVDGKTPTEFAPDDNLSRAEMVKIAMQSFGYELDTTLMPIFTDVKATDWFYSYVMTAKSLGIVSGYADSTFKPNDPITRSEALKIILVASKLDTTKAPAATFTDVPRNQWFTQYVDFAFDKKIVNGKAQTLFAPNDLITRAEMAKIAVNTIELQQ